MPEGSFTTADGRDVPSVTTDEMRAVDRVAVEEVELELLQMMENAGRILSRHVRDVRDGESEVVVVAGSGGNGGGGMACARHLANRGVPVRVLLERPPGELTGAAAHQGRILEAMAVPRTNDADRLFGHQGALVIVDALVGYGLSGAVRHPARKYVDRMNHRPDPVVSLDVPSGRDATTGETRGAAVTPDRTVTLALPKTGLDAATGALYLADIGIPATVYDRLDIDYGNPFGDRDWVELEG
jgi:NAD(P)H-hydrate epimerase